MRVGKYSLHGLRIKSADRFVNRLILFGLFYGLRRPEPPTAGNARTGLSTVVFVTLVTFGTAGVAVGVGVGQTFGLGVGVLSTSFRTMGVLVGLGVAHGSTLGLGVFTLAKAIPPATMNIDTPSIPRAYLIIDVTDFI